jgi:hypothetical protein
MKQKEPSYREQTIDVIGMLNKDTFTVADIAPHFPNRGMNNLSATLCHLVDAKLLYRTGKRVRGATKKQHFVEYTTSKSLALSGGDSTPMRGWSAEEVKKTVTEKLMSEQEKQIECLKKKLLKVREENKKLRKIIAALDTTQLINIILNSDG